MAACQAHPACILTALFSCTDRSESLYPGLSPFNVVGRSKLPCGQALRPFCKHLVTVRRSRRFIPQRGSGCRASGARSPELTEPSTQTSYFVTLPSTKRLEVIEQKAAQKNARKRPLVFLHGSYHAAWCWTVHWMPYFAAYGHDCYAISMLGQGGSDMSDEKVAGTLQSHAADISCAIRELELQSPVLVGHSFGGLVSQEYLANIATSAEEEDQKLARLSAVVLLCSAPPSGNSAMVKRFMKTKPWATIKLTWSFVAKGFANSTSLCRETFFSAEMSDAEVDKYRVQLAQSSKQRLLDLKRMNETLPVGKPPPGSPPVMVLAAANDFIVDEEGSEETAAFHGTKPAVIDNIAHDVMLGLEWTRAADRTLQWLREQKLS